MGGFGYLVFANSKRDYRVISHNLMYWSIRKPSLKCDVEYSKFMLK